MTEKEEKSLFDSLAAAGLSILPEKLKSDSAVWLQAVARVLKRDNSRNFCLVENDGFNKPKVTKGFGNIAIIEEFESIYPYTFLNDTYLPNFKNRKDIHNYLVDNGLQEEKSLNLLSKRGKTEEELAKDKQTIIDLVYCIAIKKNLYDLKMMIGNEEK